MLKNILMAVVLITSVFSVVASAEDAAPTDKGAQKAAPQKVVSVADAMQLSDGQKAALQKLQQQRLEHTKQMQIKYAQLQALSEADKLDKDKVEEVTNEMVDMVRKYAENSTTANHDFYSSLTPDQKKRMEAIAKQLKQRQQQATNKKPQQ